MKNVINLLDDKWGEISIVKKMRVFFAIVVIIVATLVAITVIHSEYQSRLMQNILNEYHTISGFNNSIKEEREILFTSVYNISDFDTEKYLNAVVNTNFNFLKMENLEVDISSKGYPYMRAIKNSVESYKSAQQNIIVMMKAMDYENPKFISGYYELISRGDYIISYVDEFLKYSIADGEKFQKEFMKNNTIYYTALIASMFLCAVIFIFLLSLLQKSIFNPLKKLYEASYEISCSNFNTPDVPVKYLDEIGSLSQTFNTMKREMLFTFNTLVEKADIEKELRTKEVENEKMQKNLKIMHFAQLQSQVNPHFLFNSLNIVASLAQIENAPSTRKMIIRMSSFFRYSLENDDNIVPLSYELETVKTYIDIQKTRFGDKINLNCPSSEEFKSILIPKFTIQPIIENSVIHGISKKENNGSIKIKIKLNEDKLIESIKIIDSGVGFGNKIKNKTHRSIGLKNIEERMKLFNKNSSVSVWSRKNIGTIVTINFNKQEDNQ